MSIKQYKTFAEQVDAVLSGEDAEHSHLEVLKVTPPLLRMVGVPNLPILMTAHHVKTITQENGSDSANYHGLGAELVKRLPELISDPVMIMDSISLYEKARKSIVVVTQTVDKENRPVIGAIKIVGVGNDGNGFEISANILTSAYGKDSFKTFIERNIAQGAVLYADKAKSQALFKTPGLQLPDNFNSLDFDIIIRKTNAFVNRKEKVYSETSLWKTAKLGKLANARAQARRLAAETGEPYVTIEWIEGADSFPGLKESEVISLYEADKRLAALDLTAEQNNDYKMMLHIDYVFEGKPYAYENCRFNIGAEGGGLVHHIDEFLKNGNSLDVQERAEAESALEYFKRHIEVSEYLSSPEKLSTLSEEEQGDINMYVSRARDVLNNSEPFSDYYHRMPLTPEEIKKGRESAHAAGLPFYEGSDDEWESFNDADGLIYDGNMSVEDYKRMWELREQEAVAEGGEVQSEEQAVAADAQDNISNTAVIYYQINEATARRAQAANSFSDYREGSATALYRMYVDAAIAVAEEQKKLVDPIYYDKIDSLLKSYAKRLADNINKSNEIEARVPSIMISGAGNFPVRKKQKQNAARDKNFQERQAIDGLLDKIRRVGKGGISSNDPNSIQKLSAKLVNLEKSQEIMKAVNAYYRKNKTLDGCPELTSEQIAELKAEMKRFPHLEGKPYPTWALSNNNAEIRRVKERIQELSKRQEVGFVGWEFNGGVVKANTADNRLQIFFEEKPDETTRQELKRNGFKWSHKTSVWQRQLTANAYYAADQINAIQPVSGEKPTALQRAHVRQHNADVAENSVQNDINQEQEKLIDDAAHWYSMERPQSKFKDCLDAVREMDAETIREYAEQYRAYLDAAAEFMDDTVDRSAFQIKTNYMYQAYTELQNKNPDAFVFCRIGEDNTYQVLGKNARIVAEQCNLPLESRDVGEPNQIPVVSIPIAKAFPYINKIRDIGNVVIEVDGGRLTLEKRTATEVEAGKVTDNFVSEQDVRGYAQTLREYDLITGKLARAEEDYITQARNEIAELNGGKQYGDHEEKLNKMPHYEISFTLDYGNEMLLNNELKTLGYERDKSLYEINERNDSAAVENRESRWVNGIRYLGDDGKSFEGFYGRTFNGITLEATDITGFITRGLSFDEVNEIAKAVRDFGIDVSIKEIPMLIDIEEKITLEEARNAMLDAQEQRQNHYAVRIEYVPYTDPEDGYESEEPAQVIYMVSQTGRIEQYKAIPLDGDVFSSDLPNGSLISYEPVEYEELEEIAKNVREPIQTFKDVLRAEIEVGTERRRSNAYYDQRVEDILDEHYQTEYGLFKRDIENPKYLSGTLYAEQTLWGEKILSLTQNENGKNVAVIARRSGGFTVAEDYSPDDGRRWGKAHYFDDQKSAEEFRTKNFPSANERTNQYQSLAASKSPLGQEYARIKGEHLDSVVFYRVGDFYEVLGADAERVAEKLDLTLVGRTIGTMERVPMCGIPFHAIDQFANMLAKKGENVVIADRLDIKTIKSSNLADEHKNELPLVINLFAGPGAGKTTAALELTAALKKVGYNVEYVSEYAKELVLEKQYTLLDNQEHVTDEQYRRLNRLRESGVEIIVTDSPVLLGKVYGEGRISTDYDKQITDYHDSFNNFNLVVKRGDGYQQAGRRETLSQAQELDKKITSLLRNNNLFYGNYNHDEIEKTVNRINTTFNRLYGSTANMTSLDIEEQARDHEEKINITEKRLREYADTLRRNDLEVGNTARTDEEYINQARAEIAAYERSDEYQQAIREDFPNDFIDDIGDSPQDMAEITHKPQNTFCTDFGGEYRYFVVNDGLTIDDVCNGYSLNPYEIFGYEFGQEITERQYKDIQSLRKGYNIDFLDDINSFTITQNGNVIEHGYLDDLVSKCQDRQNETVKVQERKREWLSIELPNGVLGGQYGENRMIKMPKGEFSYYAFYVPTRFLKEADGKTQLQVASDYTFRLNNDGRQVELTGQELRDSFAGKYIDKTYKRVAPSRKYAQGLANIEKNVPAELKAIPTWCCYRTHWNAEKGKKDKFIISPIDGKWASSKEPGKWVTFNAAMKYARENNCEGLSILLDKKYGITCIDLDKCIEVKTGKLSERASKLVEALNGTYIERSTSGNGLHIFVKDDILKNGTYNMTSVDKNKGDLEVYDDKRIMSLTGDMYSSGNTLTRAGSAATVYLRQELGERRNVSNNGVKPRPTGSLNLSDSELIRWIRGSKQGAKFDDLYSGRGVSGDRSNDDGKLAHILLYFNGGDKEQAFRIMRESGAYRPDKPDSYYRHTIDKMDEKIEVYAKRPTFSANGPGKPKGKGPGNGNNGNQA